MRARRSFRRVGCSVAGISATFEWIAWEESERECKAQLATGIKIQTQKSGGFETQVDFPCTSSRSLVLTSLLQQLLRARNFGATLRRLCSFSPGSTCGNAVTPIGPELCMEDLCAMSADPSAVWAPCGCIWRAFSSPSLCLTPSPCSTALKWPPPTRSA